jgi:metallophosphoesterase superfamily enzyme
MEAMRVGDSILLSDKHIQHARALKSRCGVNITERKQSDGTFRVWRIAE